VLNGSIHPNALFFPIPKMILKLTGVALAFVLFIMVIAGYFVLIIQDIQGVHVRILGGIVPEQVHLSSTGK